MQKFLINLPFSVKSATDMRLAHICPIRIIFQLSKKWIGAGVYAKTLSVLLFVNFHLDTQPMQELYKTRVP